MEPANSDYDTILARARDHLAYWRAAGYPAPLAPSPLWRGNIDTVLSHAEARGSLVEIFREQQENNGFTFQRLADDQEFTPICEGYCNRLAANAAPLSSFPFDVQESPLASPALVAERDGRLVSTMFFWHLSALMRIRAFVPAPETILELGGGYGGLARLARLQWPWLKYIIIDLSEALFFSYGYLCASFPAARVVWPRTLEELDAALASREYDYLMVPCAFGEALRGRLAADVVVNTASLGEMAQETVDWYLDLIQTGMTTRYLYSVNRHGYHPELAYHRDHVSSTIHLDPRWRAHWWDIDGPLSCMRIDPTFPRHLEILAERLPESLYAPETRRMLSDRSFKAARRLVHQDSEWERLMWESLRLYATRENVTAYLTFARERGFVEQHYYERVLKAL